MSWGLVTGLRLNEWNNIFYIGRTYVLVYNLIITAYYYEVNIFVIIIGISWLLIKFFRD